MPEDGEASMGWFLQMCADVNTASMVAGLITSAFLINGTILSSSNATTLRQEQQQSKAVGPGAGSALAGDDCGATTPSVSSSMTRKTRVQAGCGGHRTQHTQRIVASVMIAIRNSD